MKSDLQTIVNHFVYTFGETDGPFRCEADGCGNTTWSIFTAERMEPREVIKQKAGTALCAGHFPILYEPGSSSISNLALRG